MVEDNSSAGGEVSGGSGGQQQEKQPKQQSSVGSNSGSATESKKKIDQAWKQKVKAEKERAREEREKKEEPIRQYPEASFGNFVAGLATQALVAMGEIENPITGKLEKDLGQARYTIDVMQILREKTKGNLTEEEERILQELLYQVQMAFVRHA
jgi:signal recognition particle GTPase